MQSHIYIHIQYGIISWGNMAKKSLMNDIYIAQKACMRQICRKPKNSNTDVLFKKLRLLKLPDVVNVELSKFGYRLKHETLPKPLIKLANLKGGRKTHRYSTQNKKLPNIQKHSQLLFNNSFLCKGIVVYGNVKQNIKASRSEKSFTRAIKDDILANY